MKENTTCAQMLRAVQNKHQELSITGMFVCWLLLFPMTGFAQIDTLWTRAYEAGAWDESFAVASDTTGNIYITGSSYVWGTSCDIITVKYSPDGEELWSKIYSNTLYGWEEGKLITCANGYVYVAGYSAQSTSTSLGQFALVKYTEAGDSLWSNVYTNTYEGEPTAMQVDAQGNVILSGYDGSTSSDCVTMKIDNLGNQIWMSSYTNAGPNDVDKLWDMCTDANGNIYVTGMSDDETNFYIDIITIKYKPNGDTVWTRRFNGPSNYFDQGRSIRYDNQEHVYVGGSTAYNGGSPWNDFILLKYDTSGTLIWQKQFDNPYHSFDEFVGLELDAAGNIYAMGTGAKSNNVETNYIQLIKYTPAGDTIWTSRLDLPSSDFGAAMTMDDAANIYITGQTVNTAGQGINGLTCKFDSYGTLIWYAEFNGTLNNEDEFFALTLDRWNDLIVTGRTKNDSTVMDMSTVKYRNSTSGIPLIKSGDKGLHISTYPNPSTGSPFVTYYIPEPGNVVLRIIDLSGREVHRSDQGFNLPGNHTTTLQLSELKTGVYSLQLESGSKQALTRIILKKQTE